MMPLLSSDGAEEDAESKEQRGARSMMARLERWKVHLAECTDPPKYTHPSGRDVFKYAKHNNRFECHAGECHNVFEQAKLLKRRLFNHPVCQRGGCCT